MVYKLSPIQKGKITEFGIMLLQLAQRQGILFSKCPENLLQQIFQLWNFWNSAVIVKHLILLDSFLRSRGGHQGILFWVLHCYTVGITLCTNTCAINFKVSLLPFLLLLFLVCFFAQSSSLPRVNQGIG